MTEKMSLFVKILNIELQDCIEDIVLRMATQQRRRDRGEITEYVYRENTALLECERRALCRFKEELTRFDFSGFNDMKECEAEIERRFSSFLEEHGFPHAVEEFVDRKMRKVLQYCLGG